jgi:hypothetical protein
MKKRYAIFNFGRLSYGGFISKAIAVQEALAAPMFNTIQPSAAEVMPMINNLQGLWTLSEHRNYQSKGVRDALRYQIEDMLKQQCYYVNALANGNMDLLSFCGFELNKVPSSQPLPLRPIIKDISTTGVGGEVLVSLQGSRQTKYFVLETRDAQGSLIREATSTRVKAKVSDLPVGVLLSVRVQAFNAKGRSPWTVDFPFMIGTVGNSESVFVMKPASDNTGKKSSAA